MLPARIDSPLKEDVRREAKVVQVSKYTYILIPAQQHHYWNQHDNAAAGERRR